MLRFLRRMTLKAPLGLFLAGLLALGAVLPGGPAAAGQDIPFGQGLLWRVQKDGAPASYLLGTMHSTDPRLRQLPPAVDQALDDSRVAAFELVTGQAGDQDMSQAMQLPVDRRLEDVLGSELFERVAAAVAEFGIARDNLQRFKPWALSFFLARPRLETIRQAQGEPAFDFWLQGEAKRRGKALHGLETYAEQIEVFDGLSEAEQVAMVTDLLNDYANIEAQFNRMFRAYLKGDTATLMRVADDHSGVSDAAAAERLSQRLIVDRNHVMAERILPLLRQGRAFVAIGALHLPGEEGILALLQRQGYRITQAY